MSAGTNPPGLNHWTHRSCVHAGSHIRSMTMPHTVSMLALMVAAFASLAGVHGHAAMLVRPHDTACPRYPCRVPQRCSARFRTTEK